MATLMALRGLPGSGKTTWARTLHPEWVRVNRDTLREMIIGGIYDPNVEHLIKRIEEITALVFLSAGRNVVVDDTNLKRADHTRWSGVADGVPHTEFAVQDFFETPIEVCVERDKQRPNPVGEARIRGMLEEIEEWPTTPTT